MTYLWTYHRYIHNWRKRFAYWQSTFCVPMASSPVHLISVSSTRKQPHRQMSLPHIQDKHHLSVGVILSMATHTKFNIMDLSLMLIDLIFAAKQQAHPQNLIFCRYHNVFTKNVSKMQRFLGKSTASLSLSKWNILYSWWISMLQMNECNWKGCYGL